MASEQQVDDVEEAFAGALGEAAAWTRRTSRRRGLLAEGSAAATPPPVRIRAILHGQH